MTKGLRKHSGFDRRHNALATGKLPTWAVNPRPSVIEIAQCFLGAFDTFYRSIADTDTNC